jgi:hypothetical protein
MQTEVLDNPPHGLAGLPADHHTSSNGDIASATSEESSAEIPFGTMVAQGSNPGGCKLISGTAAQAEQTLLGIAVHGHHYANPAELGTAGVKPGTTLGIGFKGRFWVHTEEAVAPGDAVRVRVVAAGSEVKGAFRKAADSTDCVDISAFAKWRSAGAAGELAIVEIDMTNAALAAAD